MVYITVGLAFLAFLALVSAFINSVVKMVREMYSAYGWKSIWIVVATGAFFGLMWICGFALVHLLGIPL